MTIIASTMATTMIAMCSTMPIAVITESSEKMMSSSMIWTSPAKLACPAPAPRS